MGLQGANRILTFRGAGKMASRANEDALVVSENSLHAIVRSLDSAVFPRKIGQWVLSLPDRNCPIIYSEE